MSPVGKVPANTKPVSQKNSSFVARNETEVAKATGFSIEFVRRVIKEEDFRTEEYKINGVNTIGVGHNTDTDPAYAQAHKAGKKVIISKEKVYDTMAKDLLAAKDSLSSWTNKAPLNAGQKEALLDVLFNVKQTTVKKSTLLKMIKNWKLQPKNIDEAVAHFNFVFVGKNVNTGLCQRRLQNMYDYAKEKPTEIALKSMEKMAHKCDSTFNVRLKTAKSIKEKSQIQNQKASFLETSKNIITKIKTSIPQKKPAPAKKQEVGFWEKITNWFKNLF